MAAKASLSPTRLATFPATEWNNSKPTGSKWEAKNDPSPSGWRVPTLNEIKKLVDTQKVTNEWTTQNGIYGRKFTDKTNGNSLFLPAAGTLDDRDGSRYNCYGNDAYGYYWSSTKTQVSTMPYTITFWRNAEPSFGSMYMPGNGLTVRCVAVTQ